MPALTSGQSITSRYTLVRRLGAGGMGEVWQVHDRQLDTEPAAKLLVGAGPQEIDQLRRECLLARHLNHPNIVRVFDFEQQGEVALMTMEPISGTDLSRWLGASPEQIVELLLPVAGALAYAHRQGIVHRDLKLSNIVVDDGGSPHILDFGVAAAIEEGGQGGGFGGGTPGAMSPQQGDGEPPRPADDLYGFGALLYELVSGRSPLAMDPAADPRHPEPTALHSPHPIPLHSPHPIPLHSPHPIPEGLRSLVAELLAAQPGDRPPHMEAVRDRLQAIADATASATDAPALIPPPRVRPPVRPLRAPATDTRVQTGVDAGAGPVVEATADSGSRERRLRYGAIIASALLALAAITVFAVLPGWVAKRGSDMPSAPATAEVASPTPEVATLSPRSAAEAARAEATDRRSRLTARAASQWGGEAFAQALQEVRRGEQFFLDQEFPAAQEAFEEATSQLQSIDADSPRILQESLDQGRRALVQTDSATAHDAFTLALAIDPTSPAAAAGLRRAEALPGYLSLLDTGAERERRGDLQGALEAFRRARAIEPGSSEARSAIERLSARLDESTFSQAMAAGLLALDGSDFAAAREAFKRAAAERAGSPEAADGLARAERGLRTQAIAEHQQLADDAAQAEDWHTASKHYGQVLELDPALAVAQRGRALAESRATLGDRLAAHLGTPQRLTTAAVRGDAEALLERANEVDEPGPVLQRQITALTEAITAYSIPIQVVLLSDDETTVEIYRVGVQGMFQRRQLELLPGTYTVVGRRKGYQDVRAELQVVPGETPEPLTIRCKVKI